MKNTTTQTDDNEYARYLASFLCQNDYKIVRERGDYGFYLDYEELVKLITEYETSSL